MRLATRWLPPLLAVLCIWAGEHRYLAQGVGGFVVRTIAGRGAPDVGDGRPATEALLEAPETVAVAPDGTLYVVDTGNHRIRHIDRDGVIRTVAGTGSAENQDLGDGGPATAAPLRFPRGVAVGADGTLYIADSNHYVVRRIGTDGVITRVAGNRNSAYSGDGGPAVQAGISFPSSVAVDASGNVYISDQNAHRIRRVDRQGFIATIAGTGVPGTSGDGGPAAAAQIQSPRSLWLHDRTRLMFATAQAVRQVDLATGVISTVAPVSTTALAVDADGSLILGAGNTVRRVEGRTGEVQTLASGLNDVRGVSVDATGRVYVAETGAHRIRRINEQGSFDAVAGSGAIPGDDVPAADAVIFDSQGLVFDRAGNLYFSDFQHHTIRRLSHDGHVTTVAGNRRATSSGNGGHPREASFSAPAGLVIDGAGQLLFLDQTGGPACVRGIAPGADGVVDGSADERIFAVAGRCVSRDLADSGGSDGAAATTAVFTAARSLALDADGALYVADWLAHRIRRVVPGRDGVFNGETDEIITTFAGNGSADLGTDGRSAFGGPLASPLRLEFDASGHLFVYQETNDNSRRIRRIERATGALSTAATGQFVGDFRFVGRDELWIARSTEVMSLDVRSGRLERIAGGSTEGFGGDGGTALQALFRGVVYFAPRPGGGAVFADNGNYRLRALIPASGGARR